MNSKVYPVIAFGIKSDGFLSGFSMILDLGSTYSSYDIKENPYLRDTRMISSDWGIVGRDIIQSVRNVRRQNGRQEGKKGV